ncbi:hypothetical protein LRAMOSA10771 [Lichtheimia ramosa]|uniref:Cyclin n=1 Tax=Lichtheimia ramosa TaxID=688394 RepID=A0A077WP94_9FUNG|nr:hypothetical protein LRAMOSA10771 [Lichtheimia ramosa]
MPHEHQWSCNTKRHESFKVFCHKVLKATQISSACVLLSLYYIHRLRSAYPAIHASIGSEVRLFTTALILANKFLDDNTFTNKTWSDVSGIPVRELNIMEVEFLSALNYNIYISHHKYFAWANQCQQHYTSIQSHQQHNRPIKVPARLSVKPTTTMSMPSSISMPAMLPSPAVKRPASHPQQRAAKRRYHVPCTPPDETIQHQPVVVHNNPPSSMSYSSSYPRTPLYTPLLQSEMHLYPTTPATSSSCCSIISSSSSSSSSTTSFCTSTPSVCQPVLSWSSSSSALASSRHNTVLASSIASAAAANVSTSTSSFLASRVRCLEIE